MVLGPFDSLVELQEQKQNFVKGQNLHREHTVRAQVSISCRGLIGGVNKVTEKKTTRVSRMKQHCIIIIVFREIRSMVIVVSNTG